MNNNFSEEEYSTTYQPKNYETKTLLNNFLDILKDIDKKYDDINKKQLLLEEKEKLFENYKSNYFNKDSKDDICVQLFIEETELAIKELKEVISKYLLKYNYISKKSEVSFIPNIEHKYNLDSNKKSQLLLEKQLILYINFEKDRLKLYYEGNYLQIYSIFSQSYEKYISLKNHLLFSNGVLYNFYEMSKKYTQNIN